MKDRLGHGSEKRGGAAHQAAINTLVPNRANIGWVKKMAAQDSQYGQSAIDMYRARIRAGETLPPIAVSGRRIIDGHTRYLAYKAEKVKNIPIVRVDAKGYPK
jgi:ParB-like chromosome segregation protein Spo0J